MAQMENTFLKDNYNTLLRLEEGTFSGSISHEERQMFLSEFERLMGWKIKVCWTCGGSTQQMARLILNKMRNDADSNGGV